MSDDYLWTVRDSVIEYCRSCMQMKNSYCQVVNGEALVCCCRCQYVIRRFPATGEVVDAGINGFVLD